MFDSQGSIPPLNRIQTIDQTLIHRVENGRRRGWWRRSRGRSKDPKYFDRDGIRITDETHLARIRSLVIPPAWKHVRISPSPAGKVQAVGIDTRGRLQYIYHPKFRERQERLKFAKIEKFGGYMPAIRKVSSEHLALEGFPREKVLAIMIRLINSLYIRIGTDKSTRTFRTYGITTLRKHHLDIGQNGKLIFSFTGKSYVKHRKVLVDRELSDLMLELKRSSGKGKLFQYVDDNGSFHTVSPADINRYLKSITSDEFSAKDFRTWGATLLAAIELAELGPAPDEKTLKKNIVRTVKKVAAELGNTPTVCRGSYIHPLVLTAYRDGNCLKDLRSRKVRRVNKRLQAGFEPEEVSLLELFERYR